MKGGKLSANTVAALSAQGNAAASFALPKDLLPIRFSDNYATAPTALARPYYLLANDFSSGSTAATPQIPNGQGLAIIFRNPLRSLIFHDPNSSNLSSRYDANFINSLGNISNSTIWNVRNNVVTQNLQISAAYMTDHWAGNNANAHPHGSILYIGSQNGIKGTWIDSNGTANASFFTLTVTFDSSALTNSNPDLNVSNASLTLNLDVNQLNGKVWEDFQSYSTNLTVTGGVVAPAVFIIYAVESGYYSFSLGVNVTSAINSSSGVVMALPLDVSYYQTATSDWLCHLPLPNITAKMATVQSLRMNAMSLMVSCQASELNKAGRVAGLQAPAGIAWQEFVLFDDVSTANNANTRTLDNGMYCYVKPTSPLDFQMMEPFVIQNNQILGADYPLVPAHDYMVIVSQTPITTGVIAPGGNTYITTAWGIEFRTTDVWFDLEPPSLTPQKFDAEVIKLRNLPQFTENPFHALLAGGLLAGRFIATHLPQIASAIGGISNIVDNFKEKPEPGQIDVLRTARVPTLVTRPSRSVEKAAEKIVRARALTPSIRASRVTIRTRARSLSRTRSRSRSRNSRPKSNRKRGQGISRNKLRLQMRARNRNQR